MPIGTGIIYNAGDLILGTVSGSGTAFLETKIAAATSSIVYFDSNARINSASLNSITVGTASYVSGSTSIITNLTASNISASGTGSFGMVGIGTTVPAYILDIKGTSPRIHLKETSTSYSVLDIENNAGSFYFAIDNSAGTGFGGTAYAGTIYKQGAYPIAIWTNAVERMRITQYGDVGIGTNNPAHQLEVYDTVDSPTYVRINNQNSGSSAYTGVDLQSYGGGWQVRVPASTTYVNPLVFSFNATEKARITSDGNLGIGTTSPAEKLSVNGNIRLENPYYIYIYGRYASGNNGCLIYQNGTGANGGFAEIATSTWGLGYWPAAPSAGALTPYIQWSTSTETIKFRTVNADRVIIDSSGSVGIGTTSPVAALDVSRLEYPSLGGVLANFSAGTTDPTTEKYVILKQTYTGAAFDSPMLVFKANANSANSGSFGIVRTTSNGSIVFSNVNATSGTVTAVSEKMRITADGIVGIGTSSPNSWAKLEVNGTTAVNGILYINENYNIQALTAFPGSAGKLILNGDGGNVGVGTTSAYSKLTISVPATNTISTADSSNTAGLTISGTGNLVRLQFGVGSNTLGPYGGWIQASYDNTGGDNGIEPLLLNPSGGNIGIGTSSPAKNLHIRSTVSGDTGIIIENTNNAQNLDIDFWNNVGAVAGRLRYSEGTGDFYFSPNTAASEALTIKYGGNVLIGTTTSTTNGGLLQIGQVPNTTASSIGFNNEDNAVISAKYNLVFQIDNTNSVAGRLYAWNKGGKGYSDGTNLMTLNASGSLGIGTSSPAYKLDVSGSSRFGFTSTNTHQFTGSVSVVGSVTAASFTGSLSGSITSALTASYLTPTNSYTITNLTASNISASGTSIFGNVGIGTTGPSYKLDVQRTSDGTIGYFRRIGATINPALGIYANESGNSVGLNTDYVGAVSPAIAFSIASSEKVRIANDGNVGIGTTNPTAKLTVNQFFGFSGDKNNYIYMPDIAQGTGSIYMQAGFGSAAAGGAIKLHGHNATTYTGGDVEVGMSEKGDFLINTSIGGTRRVTVKNNGNVGIGSTSPANRFEVVGSTFNRASFIATANVQTGIQIIRTGGVSNTDWEIYSPASSGDLRIYNVADYVTFQSGSGNVGIGTTSPAYLLHVNSTGFENVAKFRGNNDTTIIIGGSDAGGSGEQYITYQNTTTAASAWMVGMDDGEDFRFAYGVAGEIDDSKTKVKIGQDGNVGIGTTTPAAKLEISGSSNSALLNIKSPISGAILFVSGSGAVGINTSTVGAYTLQVNGSFAATTKSFVIEHPTKAGKKLIYGSLESPYHGIRLTGRDTLVNGKCKIQLPDYIYKLILHDSVNIQLTGIKCNKTLYVDEINIPENYFTIAYDKAIFESYKDYDFFWDFTGIRTDVPELITEL